MLEMASSVMILPAYGMAVAQAQHRVAERYEHLKEMGVDVSSSSTRSRAGARAHECASGRADVPFDKLAKLKDINPEMSQFYVALKIGAHDALPLPRNLRHDQVSTPRRRQVTDMDVLVV